MLVDLNVEQGSHRIDLIVFDLKDSGANQPRINFIFLEERQILGN